ncbi:hypothetical protein [Sulfobacillus sp. hq2]|uniref:hypothetical protein n=1 Tax=Sulfobacillus sp. hq2 TaxID=2039167 RepID=UPI0011AF8E61|nr:hypothetical protein [Sulfobacillus sp. hq2]
MIRPRTPRADRLAQARRSDLHLEYGTRVAAPDFAAFHALGMPFHQQGRRAPSRSPGALAADLARSAARPSRGGLMAVDAPGVAC